METRRYPTDLSEDEWRCIGPHLPESTGRGRPRLHGSRTILDAVFYVLKSGCPWRLLPRDFPPWKSVYEWFRKWRIDGTFEHLNARPARAAADSFGQEPAPQRGHRRLAVHEDYRRGRRTEGLRWRKEGSEQKAPP